MKFMRYLFVVMIVIYVGLCAVMYFAQRGMQYRPDASVMNPLWVSLPRAVQETLTTSDGERIVTWWIAPRDASAPVYLYLHGNGANLHNRAVRFAKLTESGAGVMAVSWRGYGGSTGSPTESGFRIDARAAYDTLATVKGVNANRIIVFGESLGTTVATMLASEVPIASLVLDSSFDSALDVAARAYPWLPVRWLLHDQFRADLAAAKVRAPVQQFHCRVDPVTPLASAQTLHARFANARPIHVMNETCHVPPVTQFYVPLQAFVEGVMMAGKPQ
jgi:uncharacterized protein